MKKLLTLCLLAVTMCAVAQEQTETKRIAILETVDKTDKVDYAYELQLRQSLTFAINITPGYKGYNRLDMAQINNEHNFQRTGFVSDADIKKLGQMAGAAYVLIAEVTPYSGGKLMILANLVNVESGEIENSTPPITSAMDDASMAEACKKIAQTLLNVSGGSSTSSSSSYSPSSSYFGAHADFTETAWGINMKMIWVEGGDFLMGCTSEQGDCADDEKNVRRVTVDGYWIGMCEVTQSQWEAVMGTSIYQQGNKAYQGLVFQADGVGPNYPMYCVSWDEAMEFCRLLSNKTGKTYTLPTEAQWEYAARGGNKADGTKYAGNNMVDAVAWYVDNSGNSTHPVATKRPNGLGLYDMSGNVWEWCKDWYSEGYAGYDTNNPTGASSGSERVIRGGSWYNEARFSRVSCRFSRGHSQSDTDYGFRVVVIP